MATPVYALFILRWRDTWHQIDNPETRTKLVEEAIAAYRKSGVEGEILLQCNSLTTGVDSFELRKFPNMESLMKLKLLAVTLLGQYLDVTYYEGLAFADWDQMKDELLGD